MFWGQNPGRVLVDISDHQPDSPVRWECNWAYHSEYLKCVIKGQSS